MKVAATTTTTKQSWRKKKKICQKIATLDGTHNSLTGARATQSANERKRKRQHAVENGAKCGEREKMAIVRFVVKLDQKKEKMRTDRGMQKATVERAVPETPIDKRIYWILRNCSDAATMAATATPGDAAAAKHIRIPISFDLFSLVSPAPPPSLVRSSFIVRK